MANDFKEYFDNIITHIEGLGDLSLALETRIGSTEEQVVQYQNFFADEIADIKSLIHDLNLFVHGLTKQFEKLQDSSSDFVSKEELEELSLDISRLNFENLQLRSTFKEKL